MNLIEARDFVSRVRPTWQPDAKGYITTMININHAIDVLGGDTDVNDITPMSYITIQECKLAEGKSKATVNRITSALSTLLSELRKHRLVDEVVRCPNSFKESRGRVTYYTAEEIQAMLEATKQLEKLDREEVHDIILLAAKTGCRQGELLKLTWDDIDFDQNLLVFVDTKNGEDRVLPLTDTVRECLERRYQNRINDELVFWIGKDTLLRRFKRVQKLAGIKDVENRCFHTIRHSAATSLFERGASLPEVMEVLGHKQSSTTLRYSHATAQGKLKAMNLLDD
jgi:integrase